MCQPERDWFLKTKHSFVSLFPTSITKQCLETVMSSIHVPCLINRPHYSALPKRFGSRAPSEDVSRPFASDTSPK